jgi:threonine dehydrogenase-like Zn-dependent dehydrogenase
MLAAVFAGPGKLELQERRKPVVRSDDDVLVEVEACGICGTDLHILDVPPRHPAAEGVILGHEYIGTVVEAGNAVASLGLGDRVAIAPNIACDRCQYCRAGLVNHCEHFTTLGIFRDGGLTRYNLVPERACFPIRKSLPWEEAVWTEVLSCVVNSVENVRAQPGETAVVIGGGPVGALHALLFQAAGARAALCDIQQPRLDYLKRIGFERTFHSGAESFASEFREVFPHGADIVVDAVGTQLPTCVKLARVGGRISLFGMNSQALPPTPQNSITRKELTIYGSYIGVHTFPKAIRILENDVIRPSILISTSVPLPETESAFAALRGGEIMKAVIQPGA